MKRHIPNLITCLNLLSGALAIVFILSPYGEVRWGVYLIVLAAIFDFFDGMVARSLGVTSPIGKDLDSLADVVSFGLAPAILIFQSLVVEGFSFWAASPALLIAAGAGLRLARFNNDTRQTTSFIGLPVPANALFWIGVHSAIPSLLLLVELNSLLIGIYLLIALLVYLMLSEIPMFSFKVKSRKLKDLQPQILLVVASVCAIVFLGVGGFSVAILAYVLLSVLQASK